jgi:hypothetical protein
MPRAPVGADVKLACFQSDIDPSNAAKRVARTQERRAEARTDEKNALAIRIERRRAVLRDPRVANRPELGGVTMSASAARKRKNDDDECDDGASDDDGRQHGLIFSSIQRAPHYDFAPVRASFSAWQPAFVRNTSHA